MNSEHVFLVGLSRLNALPACRERAAIGAAELPGALAELKAGAGLAEVVLLSTCSRVEVVGAARDPLHAAESVKAWFIRRMGADVAAALSVRQGREAVHHLFRVACGLDSWIIGESEILGQVRLAYQAAHDLKMTGRVLNRVFQMAVSAGKSVRSRTGIQNGIHSIGGAAALLVKRIFQSGSDGQTLVVGAGQAAEAVVRHLAAKDFRRILVANRTFERAQALAASLGGEALPYLEGLKRLDQVEVAVFSASCSGPLLFFGRAGAAHPGAQPPAVPHRPGIPAQRRSFLRGAPGRVSLRPRGPRERGPRKHGEEGGR